MHSIKKAARRQAWYNDDRDGQPRTYNFFGRMNPRSRTTSDEESQLQLSHIQSGNDVPSTTETQRRQDAADNISGFAGPHKAGTYPPGLGDRDRGVMSGDIGHLSSAEDKPSSSSEYAEKDPETSNPATLQPTRSIDDSVGPNADTSKARKRRKFFKVPFGKKNDTEVERADTDTSKKRRKNPHLTFMSQVKSVFGSWINILLIIVPVGIALANVNGINGVVVFVVNFIAIIPLAAMLSYATEELAMYIGEVLGGLLNATFGNAVELIVSIIALTQGKVLIVQTSLIGSMLSNLLLVLGMCFFFGGINRSEQHFNITVAQTASSLLALAIGSLIIPTAFQIFSVGTDKGVTPLSRGTAVLLLVTYACYLLFQLRTHTAMYNEPSQKTPKRSTGKKDAGEASKGIAMIGAASGAATAGGRVNQENLVQDIPDEEETPNLSRVGALVTLAIATVFIALCAEYMVSAINDVAESVSQEFIGLILLPIVGNAAEHATAVTVAIKDKMDLSIGVAVGSSLQIALLVLPVMVMLNWWGVGGSAVMNLDFDGFLVVVLVLSIWLVNYLITDGKSHWLEGVLLMITYLIIATAAWFYPAQGDVAG